MIKQNELRIGNWVKEKNGRICKVYSEEIKFANTFLLYPISLTTEILEKAGFTFITDFSFSTGEKVAYKVYKKGSFTYNEIQGNWWLNKQMLVNTPKYLHQLQNLYFALTGEELEIKDL